MESFPSAPTYSSNIGVQPELQQMRVLVGAPLRRPPNLSISVFPSIDSETVDCCMEHGSGSADDEKFIRPKGLSDVFIFCTSDFTTVFKEVHFRTRRVRLLGLEVLICYIINNVPRTLVCLPPPPSVFGSQRLWLIVLYRVLVKLLFSRQYSVKANLSELPILGIWMQRLMIKKVLPVVYATVIQPV